MELFAQNRGHGSFFQQGNEDMKHFIRGTEPFCLKQRTYCSSFFSASNRGHGAFYWGHEAFLLDTEVMDLFFSKETKK
jgi:hypothetical protein